MATKAVVNEKKENGAPAQQSESRNINIADYFKNEEEHHKEVLNQLAEKKKALQDNLNESQNKISNLEKDKSKKAILMKQTADEGIDIDTEKLNTRIKEIDKQISAEKDKQDSLEHQINKIKDESHKSFSRQHKMAKFLAKQLDCNEALKINGIILCYSSLNTDIVECDKSGHPLKMRIYFGCDLSHEFMIKNGGERFWINFRPDTLRWLPISAFNTMPSEKNVDNNRKFLAFFDTKTSKFMLSKTEFEWTREGDKNWNGRIQDIEENDDFSDVAISINTHISKHLEKVKNEIDILCDYPADSIEHQLKAQILDSTTNKPQLIPCEEHLTTSEIYAYVKKEWDAFISCPWTGEVKGDLALLKFHVENNEKPRFWSCAFKDHFGFRLRTRDHSWITGEIFLSLLQPPSTKNLPLTIHKNESGYGGNETWVASLGRFFLKVG
jgi:hypothetical protein